MKNTERDNVQHSPRNIRLDAGLSGVDVAYLTGITPAAQSRFERQTTNPKAATLAVFYAACGRYDLVSYLLPFLGHQDRSRVTEVMQLREARYGSPVDEPAG